MALPAEDDFEIAESGASYTCPVQAGDIKKGDYAILKSHPCKVSNYTNLMNISPPFH
jgi:translation initiation factor 5A